MRGSSCKTVAGSYLGSKAPLIADLTCGIRVALKVQTVRHQEEVLKPHNKNAVFVIPTLDSIFDDNDFFEGIPNVNQWFLLLLHLLGIGDSKGRLDVVALISPVADKIHFQAFTNTLSVFGFFGALDHPDINMTCILLSNV